jgi:hypothetical protein
MWRDQKMWHTLQNSVVGVKFEGLLLFFFYIEGPYAEQKYLYRKDMDTYVYHTLQGRGKIFSPAAELSYKIGWKILPRVCNTAVKCHFSRDKEGQFFERKEYSWQP